MDAHPAQEASAVSLNSWLLRLVINFSPHVAGFTHASLAIIAFHFGQRTTINNTTHPSRAKNQITILAGSHTERRASISLQEGDH